MSYGVQYHFLFNLSHFCFVYLKKETSVILSWYGMNGAENERERDRWWADGGTAKYKTGGYYER